MSLENVEVVRTIYRLWSEDAPARHLVDPELEYVNPPYAVESGRAPRPQDIGQDT